MSNTICIIGAGTMGSGITQAVAQSGITVLLYDVDETILDKARSNYPIKPSIFIKQTKNFYIRKRKYF